MGVGWRGASGCLGPWVPPPSGLAILPVPPPGLCVGFNVDVRRPRLFHGPAEAQFGYKVLQRVGGGEKW